MIALVLTLGATGGAGAGAASMPTAIADYIARVEADGGTVIGIDNLKTQLAALGYNEHVYLISKAYQQRVTDDGGTLVGITNLENELLTLI